MPISKLKASSIASGTIDNARISLDAAEIPALPTSKITSGTFDDARIAASNVSQHATSFDDNKLVNDLSTLGLRVHTQENLSASNTNSCPLISLFTNASLSKLVRTYIADEEAGAAVKVILFMSPDPSTPKVNALPEPGSCLTLSMNTCNANSPPAGTAFAKSNVVVEPSPVNVSLVGATLNNSFGFAPIYAINYSPYTSSNTDTIPSAALAVLEVIFKISLFVPSPCKTSLFPDITSNEEPAGILASFTI